MLGCYAVSGTPDWGRCSGSHAAMAVSTIT